MTHFLVWGLGVKALGLGLNAEADEDDGMMTTTKCCFAFHTWRINASL